MKLTIGVKMASNAKRHMSDATSTIYKCVVIRKGNLRTPFYAHTTHLAKQNAQWFVRSNRLEEYTITDPVEVFQNKPYS